MYLLQVRKEERFKKKTKKKGILPASHVILLIKPILLNLCRMSITEKFTTVEKVLFNDCSFLNIFLQCWLLINHGKNNSFFVHSISFVFDETVCINFNACRYNS